MRKQQFILNYLPHAERATKATGVPAIFALAQSALETGWGKHAPGNMMFGIKVGSGQSFGGWKGHKQLITTTEYSSSNNLSFPHILPGYPIAQSNGKWKYRIKDYFRAYDTPEDSFKDWGGLLGTRSRYQVAFQNRGDPFRFAEEIAKAGYATDPHYASKIQSMMQSIAEVAQQQELWKNPKAFIIPGIALLVGIATLVIAHHYNKSPDLIDE